MIVPSTDGGVKIGPVRWRRNTSSASARNSGVKSMRSSSVIPCREKGAGRVGKGCVGHGTSPGTVLSGTARSSTGHTGSPVTRSSTYVNAVFPTATTASISRPSTSIVTRPGGAGRS